MSPEEFDMEAAEERVEEHWSALADAGQSIELPPRVMHEAIDPDNHQIYRTTV